MALHRGRPATGAADIFSHRHLPVAPGKEPGSRTEFSSDKDAADIHVHAYASARSIARAGAPRGKKCFAALHGN